MASLPEWPQFENELCTKHPGDFGQFEKGNIRFELNRGNDWKGESICPMIPEMDRPKKYD